MSTKTQNDGSPDPSLQTKDGKTAGTESEQNVKNVCPECGSPVLRFGSRDPCEGDYYWCNVCGFGPILFPLYHAMPVTSIPNEQPCPQCLKGTMFLEVEDDGSLWYVCNNKCCKHDQEAHGIIDSDTIDAVIHLGGKAEALKPGFDARAWLEARGL